MKIPKNTPLSIQKLDVAFAWVMETVVHNESEHCLVNAAVKKITVQLHEYNYSGTQSDLSSWWETKPWNIPC